MSGSHGFQVSTTLVALCGQGARMSVLLADGHADSCQLPEKPVTPGVHPLVQAGTWLETLGFDPQRASLHPLGMKGFHNPAHKLSQGILAWFPNQLHPPKSGFWQNLGTIPSFAESHGSFICEALACFWAFMPSGKPGLASITPFSSQPDPHHVIFFGGSFNPWHRAHLVCIELCPQPENVVVVPDFNPRKAVRNQSCPWQVFRQLSLEIASTGAHVYPGFCGLEYPNPTVSWLPFTQLPQRQMLMGDDSFVTLPGWIRAETLVQALDHLWVVPRQSLPDAIAKSKAWLTRTAPHCQIHFLEDHPYRDLSSTKLRAKRQG